MTLSEAIESTSKGNFVAHLNFSRNESMHMYNGQLYYEDGATGDIEGLLRTVDWAKQGWYIKHSNEEVYQEKLSKMHKDSDGLMLRNGSYEDCIVDLLIK